jgi:hypothetical protein
MLKHLKEEPHHKFPYHDLSSCREGPRSRRYGSTSTSRLLVQHYDEDYYYYYYYYYPFPSNGWNEIDRGRLKYAGKTYPIATLSTIHPTWTDPESNPVLRGEISAANHLSHVTA